MRYTVLLGSCLSLLVGCATYHDDLERGQHYYDLNQYNNALSVWRILEVDWDSLTYAEQARYAFLRGMTDYRMGYRADARHWLATSKAVAQHHPGGLDAKSLAQLEQALTELNTAVYAMGPPPSAEATGVELTNIATDQNPLVNNPPVPAAPAAASNTADSPLAAPAVAPTTPVSNPQPPPAAAPASPSNPAPVPAPSGM
jgi:hypothetical protein